MNIPREIIVNVRDELEFNWLINSPFLNDYLKANTKFSDLKWEFYGKYNQSLCFRFYTPLGAVFHDVLRYYEREYSKLKILTVEEFFEIYDPENNPYKNNPYKVDHQNYNKNMIAAIKSVMEKRHAS